MLNPVYSSKFKKDYKICKKRGLDMRELNDIMLKLENETPLEARFKQHPLRGDYSGCLECHVESDWLLIYRIDKDASELYFVRTGTHSDLLE